MLLVVLAVVVEQERQTQGDESGDESGDVCPTKGKRTTVTVFCTRHRGNDCVVARASSNALGQWVDKGLSQCMDRMPRSTCGPQSRVASQRMRVYFAGARALDCHPPMHVARLSPVRSVSESSVTLP